MHKNPNDIFCRDALYEELKEGIEIYKVLSIHIPGTGCLSDTLLPSYVALKNLVDASSDDVKIPCVFLQGVGSQGKGYIAPVMSDTHTLADKKASFFNRTFGFFSSNISCVERISGSNKYCALAAGAALGAGKDKNVERIINLLTALEEDKTLPQSLYLSGFSRGAINIIELAAEVFIQFGNKIQIHMMLTDPVPGPFHPFDWKSKIIPPNVVSFTCFYARDETRSFFKAHDLSQLNFTNPLTTITTRCFPGNHVNFFGSFIDIAYKNIAIALTNYISSQKMRKNLSENLPCFPNDSHGKGARADSIFYWNTPINNGCPKALIDCLNEIRGEKEAEYLLKFKSPEIPAKERKAYLKNHLFCHPKTRKDQIAQELPKLAFAG